MNLKAFAEWFIKAGKNNQVIIIFLFVVALLTYDRVQNQKKINELEYRQFRSDSISVVRYNAVVFDYQKKIEDCKQQSIDQYIQQNEKFQKKFEEIFKQSDKYYYELQKLKEKKQ